MKDFVVEDFGFIEFFFMDKLWKKESEKDDELYIPMKRDKTDKVA